MEWRCQASSFKENKDGTPLTNSDAEALVKQAGGALKALYEAECVVRTHVTCSKKLAQARANTGK